MCGIAGILHFNSTSDNHSQKVIQMTNALAHRGPDADGFFIENEIALGHRRLSIIDLSTSANQPLMEHSGRYVIVFNGEMYNYAEVRAMLKDYPFKTSSDTETIVAAYAKWGVKCIEYFKGMFAFAIWDRQEKELCIVRDRLGVKPLYYYMDNDKILFSSEIRSILASGLVKPKINQVGLHEYFSFRSLSYPLTMIEGIQQLEAGTYLKIKNGTTQQGQYWSVSAGTQKFEYPGMQEIQKRIKQLMVTAVQRRLVSDVPVGAFLSGGIDSSAVVGLMAEECNIKPDTFNISFSEKAFDESEYAEMVAKKFNTNHTKIQLSPEAMLAEVENALSAMDTPSGDGINTYVVSKAIKQTGIKVALSGIGGDEIFAGYAVFKNFQQIKSQKLIWNSPYFLRRIFSAILATTKLSKKKYSQLQQVLLLPSGDVEQVYPILRQMFTQAEIGQFLNIATNNTTAIGDKLASVKQELSLLPTISQLSAAEFLGYTQHTLLKDIDQMSMAVALEVREPLLDTDLIEYVMGVPDKFKQPLYPKSLMVESIKPLLPDEIVFRKKQGFVFPWKLWLKNELRSFCEGKIERMREREFINSDKLNSHWKKFLNNDPSIRWSELWTFVVLEHWLEKNGIE